MLKRIGLLGQSGSPNLGDVAIQEAAISAVRKRIPDVEIVAICARPEDAKRVHGVDAIPSSPVAFSSPQSRRRLADQHSAKGRGIWQRVRDVAAGLQSEFRFSRACLRRLREFDLVIVSGGGQIDDFWGGPWAQPYMMFRWALLSRIAGTRFAIASVGVEDMDSGLSRLFFRGACRLASHVSFRYQSSLASAMRYSLVRQAHVSPDLAYGLDEGAAIRGRGRRGAGAVIGISPIAATAWRPDEKAYSAYLDYLAEVSESLIALGHEVVFFVSQTTMDPPVVDAIISRIQSAKSPDRLRVSAISTLDSLLREIDEFDVVVASRLHSIILSQVCGKPVVALSYCEKTASAMSALNQEDFCLELERLNVTELKATIDSVVANYDKLSAEISTQVERFGRELDLQYDALLAGY